MTRLSRRAALLGLPAALAGCSTFDNLFGDNKATLSGAREEVLAARRGLTLDSSDRRAIVLPPPNAVADWPQAGGNAAHVVGQVAVTGLQPGWRASIGAGGGYRAKITAQPVVSAGRVYTMDSDGLVAAFDAGTGSRLWRTDTQDEKDRSTNVGGGVAIVGGTVYATTGRGEAMALDAGTGAIQWRKPLDAPGRSPPTLADGRMMMTTLDNRLICLSARDGERLWSYQGGDTPTTLLTAAAPAISDGFVVTGFGSGDLVTLRAETGGLAWSDSLASSRGRNSLVDLAAIRGMPVLDRGRVFAISAGGLLVSLDLRSGRRLWERQVAGTETPWLAGDWLFVQTLDQSLTAINREDGRVRWISDLPRYDNPEKRRDPIFWSGPVLAGGKLILAGSNELALSVDPLTGTILGKADLRGPAAMAPIAAAGSVFFVTDDGTIQAFR